MKRIIITLMLALCLAGSAAGQPRVVGIHLWESNMGRLSDIYATDDGGFVACGWNSNGQGWILKTDNVIQTQWIQATEEDGLLLSIVETDDLGFLAGGYFWLGHGDTTAFGAIRTDENGNVRWFRSYCDGRCSSVLELKNGNFLLIGYIGYNQTMGHLVMVNANGDVIWERSYQEGAYFSGGRETDGGMVVSGLANGIWAMKVNFDGESIWHATQRLEGWRTTQISTMVSMSDGGFLIGGTAYDQESRPVIAAISNWGEWQWSRLMGDVPVWWDGWQLARWRNDGFVIAGTGIENDGGHDGLLFRLDNQGEIRWLSSLGTYDNCYGVVFGHDGSIVACGRNDDPRCAAIVEIEPEVPGPTIGFRRPDSVSICALPEDSITFAIRAGNQWGDPITYAWFYNDSLIANDSITTVTFHQRGQIAIAGRAYSGGDSAEAVWQVDVVDLYIVAQTPDTLNLSVRRMSSVDFSIDSVRAVGGIENVDFQWYKTNLDNQEQDDAGQDSHALIEFPEAGSFRVEGQAYRGASIDHVFWNVHVRAGVLGIGAASVESEPGRITRVPIAVFNDGQDTLHWQAAIKTMGEAGSELGTLRHTIAVGRIANDDRIEGVVFDGESYFCAGSNGDNPNVIYKLNRQGELLGSFPQPGHSRYGFKDLEWDGELIWGSGEDSVFAITRDGEVAYRWRGPFNPTHNIAYDPDQNVLWLCGTTTNIVAYDREGNALGMTINRQGLRHYGLAWYADDPDSACLYDLNLPGGDLPPQINKFNPATGEMSLVTTLALDSANSLNGAFICRNYDKYQAWVMMSIGNIAPAFGGDQLQIWQLQPNTEWLTVFPDSGAIPAGQNAEVEIRVRTAGWDGSWAFEVGEYEGEVVFDHNGQGGRDVLPVHLRVVEPNGVEPDGQGHPSSFALFSAYPNPFNATTRIAYSLPSAGYVTLCIYSLTGREVARLVDGTVPAGTYSSEVNLANLPSGLYILRLSGSGEVRTAKLMLIK